MFGILENHHCWRFRGSGVMQGFEIVGLIFFSTRMHYEYFFQVCECASMFLFLFKNSKNVYHPLMENSPRSVLFRGDFTIKTVVGFVRRYSFEKCVIRWGIFFIHMPYFSCWPVFLFYMQIVAALVSCRNLDNVYCFGTIFTNDSHPPLLSYAPLQSENREVVQLSKFMQPLRWNPLGLSRREATETQHCNSEFTKWHDMYTLEERAGEWMQTSADFAWLPKGGTPRHPIYHRQLLFAVIAIIWFA